MKTKRLFIAISIPSELKTEIRKATTGITAETWYKAVKTNQMHLTLHFIGNYPDNDIPALIREMTAVQYHSFELNITAPGFFPSGRRPKIFWLGLKKTQQLLELKTKIDAALKKCGIKYDNKTFTPHITLARLKNPPGYAGAAIKRKTFPAIKAIPLNAFTVDKFTLFSSSLTAQGAVYTNEADFYAISP